MHRLKEGDEWVLGTLAKGNARFGEGSDHDWQAPLGAEEAALFVADPDTVCIVAIEIASNNIAGFIYGGVLRRRHTRLNHLYLHELGIDADHRKSNVGQSLMAAFAGEARALGIDRGFVITNEANKQMMHMCTAFGGLRGDGRDVLFVLAF